MVLASGHGLIEDLKTREEAWHYEGGKRDLRLDLLRGFAALAMIADHIGGERSWLYPITGGNRFFVSAAEAFVFISGAVLGIVYLQVFQKQGLAAALMKTFHRAWSLYVITILLTLSFAAIGAGFNFWWSPDVRNGGLAGYVLDVLTLHRTIFLVDVLLMYVFLLLAAGPVILLVSQGHTRTALAGSWLLWLVWQLAPSSAEIPWKIQDNEVFFFPTWQVLFVTGIAIGWHRNTIEQWVRSLSKRTLMLGLTAAGVILIALYVAQLIDLASLRHDPILYALAFDKPDLPVGRLVVFGLIAVVSFSLTTELWAPIHKATGWLLLPLGQNALTAYSAHIFVVALTLKLSDTALAHVSSREVIDTALQIAGIGLVWLFIRFEWQVSQPVLATCEDRIRRCFTPLRIRLKSIA